MASATPVPLAPTAAPATATPAQIVAGQHAQPGPSGKPETSVAIHHHHSHHFLFADGEGKLFAHSDFNAPHHVVKHRQHGHQVHQGHWHIEHHGHHHKIRSAHGHYLHANAETGKLHLHENPEHEKVITSVGVICFLSSLPFQSHWNFIADAEHQKHQKHHLQGHQGKFLHFADSAGAPPVPSFGATAHSTATGVQVVPPAVAHQTAAGTSPNLAH